MYYVNFLLENLGFFNNQSISRKFESVPWKSFHSYGLLNDFPIELVGKIVAIDVEVVDAQLSYNHLLGWS